MAICATGRVLMLMPFIVAGLTTGSIFALAGVGLVLTYKTSGIFNFAHGALATVSAFSFYFLHVQHGLAWPIAALVCVFVEGPIVGLLLELIARRLASVTLATKVLATVGVLLTAQGGIDILFPPGPDREVPQFLPQKTVSLFGTPVETYRFVIFGFGLLAVIVLTAYLRYSRTGVSMRAVVDNPLLLDVMGTSPVRVRRLAWLIGSGTASASGVLLAPLLPLDATTVTFLVVTAFGAAAIGAFTNLPLTYLGGLAIGVGQALLQRYFVSSTGLTAGLASALPFLVLFVLLLVAPRLRTPSSAGLLTRIQHLPWKPPGAVRVAGALMLLAVLAVAPQFAGLHIDDWTRFLAYIVLFLSLGLLVRMSGQVSLAHVSFMAIGAAAFSHIAVDHHWPWLLALLAAAVIAAPVGAVLAIPAIRFPGLYLALATLGFGLLLQNMFYGESYFFGNFGVGLTIPRPQLSWLDLSSDTGYYYMVLAVVILATILVFAVERSRLGRLLRAMADSPAGVASCGTSINVSRVLVFCLSASLAAVAGVLDGGVLGVVGGDNYQPITSLQLFALIVLTFGDAPWYAVMAAFGQVLAPAYISTSPTVGYVLTLLFGVGAIAHSVTSGSARQFPAFARRALDRLALRRNTGLTPTASVSVIPRRYPVDGVLSIENVAVSYGGLKAVDGVSLEAKAGKITGLIGPNGAGKTTTFNACTGIVRPNSGTVRLDGRSINREAPSSRARRGLGRTFQQMELFDSLTVRQNVAMGAEGHFAGWNPVDHVITRPAQRQEIQRYTADALTLCALTSLADQRVGSLSTGQRRLVELARCVAGPFHLLLLDEPSSGLDRVETERFGDIVRRVVDERHIGVLLIEHDMELVNRLCDRIHVLDFGKPIFAGTVPEVRSSALVRSAYLGDDDSPDLSAVEAEGVSS
jgi:ABC-type branched-subunit amino acid transport system ATPase component/branched-subunit amino acid ABC-type transport system permease component